MRNFTIALVMFLSTLGPSLIIAFVGNAAIKALGRNPSAASKIFLGMAVMLVFVETISIVAILMIFQTFSTK